MTVTVKCPVCKCKIMVEDDIYVIICYECGSGFNRVNAKEVEKKEKQKSGESRK